MLFPTFTFAVFFLIVMPLSWLTMPKPHRWRLFIIAASYVFYGWWDPRYVFLLAASTLVNQAAAHAIHRAPDRRRAKFVLIAGLIFDVGLLAWFKYYDFFVTSGQQTLSTIGVGINPPLLQTVIPVGLSFYTFMAISYIVDVYRGDFAPVSLSRFAAFLSFFPHLVAGPIVRPSELIPQFDEPRDPRKLDSSRAFGLIVGGLFLKIVLATTCATLADKVFGAPSARSALETLVGIYAYAIQIFSDFAGYTFIAIGIALLLGFEFPQNFNSPYSATSLQDFWRRWHMTLSRWLRDYVYIPLGGSRQGASRTYVNLMATMLIGGLWHGAGWTFVFWGALHGTGLAWERWRREHATSRRTIHPWVARLACFHFVCFAWVFFRAKSFGNAIDVLGRLFTGWGQPSPGVTLGVLAAIATGLAIQFVPWRTWGLALARFSAFPLPAQGVALAVILMIINVMGPRGVAPFIYFQF